MIGLLTLHLRIPGCNSLKEKRSRIKPLLARLHKEFNVSVAEMDRQDAWRETVLGCAMVGNDRIHLERTLQALVRWMEENWPDMQLIDDKIELI